MLKRTILGLSLALIVGFTASAQPKVEFSGFLDADVWTDLEGSFYSNNELDLGMTLGFTENVAAHVYATVITGSVPAGEGRPSQRWASLDFDGIDIEFSTDFGTFTVGDLVYQYGGFNYYFYKRLSMITPESFTRGLQYSIGTDVFTQTVLVGSNDGETALSMDPNALDVGGLSNLAFTENMSLGVMYGLNVDIYDGFESSGLIYGGLEFLATAGEMLALKADIGLLNVPKVDEITADGVEFVRSTGASFLLEPALTMGRFSTAASFFALLPPEDFDALGYYGISDELFVYVEPGYAFTDMFAFGLPVEYHAYTLDNEDDDEIWLVPTFYVLPTDGVQWWIWGQTVIPTAENGELGYALGSELIVEF